MWMCVQLSNTRYTQHMHNTLTSAYVRMRWRRLVCACASTSAELLERASTSTVRCGRACVYVVCVHVRRFTLHERKLRGLVS